MAGTGTKTSNVFSLNHDTIKEEPDMKQQNNNEYVTKQDLQISELKTQNKLDKLDAHFNNIENKIDGLKESFNLEINGLKESINLKIENEMLKSEQKRVQEQKEWRRFFWGTIVIGGLGVVIAIIGLFR